MTCLICFSSQTAFSFSADRFQLGIRGPEVIEVVAAVFVGNDAVHGKQPFSVYDA